MNRFVLCFAMTAGIAALPALAQSGAKSVPRALDGHADLTGIWTNATLTPLERPAQFKDKPTLTNAEAAAFEQAAASDLKTEDGQSYGKIINAAGSAGTGGYNSLFIDRGSRMERMDGVARSSLIVDPPDGRTPPLTAAAKQRNMEMFRSMNRYNSIMDRPLSERCIIGFGSTSGPPMLPVLYNNNYQIVQTKDTVMIMIEMVHDIRIVRIGGTHPPSSVRELLGDSIGHWEGDTLVVDTTNFTDQTRFHGSGENLHVVERFTRISPTEILYKATMDDPSTWASPWTVEFPFSSTKGPIFEYACHEGNYAVDDILGGARKSGESRNK